jgi:hypothetical protein
VVVVLARREAVKRDEGAASHAGGREVPGAGAEEPGRPARELRRDVLVEPGRLGPRRSGRPPPERATLAAKRVGGTLAGHKFGRRDSSGGAAADVAPLGPIGPWYSLAADARAAALSVSATTKSQPLPGTKSSRESLVIESNRGPELGARCGRCRAMSRN